MIGSKSFARVDDVLYVSRKNMFLVIVVVRLLAVVIRVEIIFQFVRIMLLIILITKEIKQTVVIIIIMHAI